jgi:transposase
MGRKKTLLTLEYKEIISSDIRSFSHSDIIIKLKAVFASLENKEEDVANIFGITRSSLSKWIKNYKLYGVEGLESKRRGHTRSKLSKEEKTIIKDWVINCSTSQGEKVHWTLSRLINEISKVFNKKITKSPLWLMLISMGLSLKKPRPEHHKSDAVKQEEFKKNSNID